MSVSVAAIELISEASSYLISEETEWIVQSRAILRRDGYPRTGHRINRPVVFSRASIKEMDPHPPPPHPTPLVPCGSQPR